MAVNPNLTIRYAEVDLDYERVLAETSPEGDGPVWMVNFMKYRPVAEYVDGRATDLTGEQADDHVTCSRSAISRRIARGRNR